MRRSLAPLLMLAATTAPLPLLALPGALLRGIDLQQPRATVEAQLTTNLSASGSKPLVHSASASQEYAEGVLRSDFLAALNRARAAAGTDSGKHPLLDDPGQQQVTVVSARSEAGSAQLAFAGDKLQAIFVRVPVAPDTSNDAFKATHLAPIRDFIRRLTEDGCSLKGKPDGRNTFIRTGQCSRALTYVEYRPATNEYWVVYHSN